MKDFGRGNSEKEIKGKEKLEGRQTVSFAFKKIEALSKILAISSN